jgi:hypothetical protein
LSVGIKNICIQFLGFQSLCFARGLSRVKHVKQDCVLLASKTTTLYIFCAYGFRESLKISKSSVQ